MARTEGGRGGGGASRRHSHKRPRSGSNGRQPRRRDRPPSDSSGSEDAPEDGEECQGCSLVLRRGSDRVVVRPCQHVLCTFCALKSQTERGSKLHQCPVDGCKRYSTQSDFIRGGDASTAQSIRSIGGENPREYTKNNLPLQWLKEQHMAELKDHPENEGIVLFSGRGYQNSDGNYETKIVSSTFVLTEKVEGKVEVLNPNRAVVEIANFFATLHRPLLKASLPLQKHLPMMSPRELLEFRCRQPFPIDRALLSMVMGMTEFNDSLFLNRDMQDYQKKYLSSLAASDLLLQNLRTKPGYFQLMYGELLNRQRSTREFRDLCSAFNLAPSRSFSLKERADKVLKQMKEGLKVAPRDLVLLFFDNMGFKILGRQASYDQWILIKVVVVTESDLKKAGFYRDDDPNNRISREPTVVWEDAIKDLSQEAMDKLAGDVVGIKDMDHERLSECVLENIQFVLDNREKLSLDNQTTAVQIPRFDRIVNQQTRKAMEQLMEKGHSARAAVAQQTAIRQSAVLARNEMPTDAENEIGGRGVQNFVTNADAFAGEDESEGDEDELDAGGDKSSSAEFELSKSNRYKMNNARLEAVHQDLAKTVSLRALADYMVGQKDAQMNQWRKEKDKYPSNAEAPLAEVMIGSGCDGKPAADLRRIFAQDAEDFGPDARRYPDTMFVSPGGFHTIMKLINASGELFEEFLTDMWSAFRDSLQKVKWILKPTDPRQRQGDYSFCLLANYARAAQNLKDHVKRGVSAVEVNDFMLERAQEYAICALALLEIRIGAIAKMMTNAERLGPRGSVDYFFSALRFAMPLFAITHKVDYMLLASDLLRWYHCASPAQRVIYENHIFTLLTSQGMPIYHDNSVENCVMDVRAPLGKVYRPGMDLNMELVTAGLPDTAGESAAHRTLHDKDAKSASNRSRTHDVISNSPACPYYKIAEKIDDARLWSPGVAPRIKLKGKSVAQDCRDDIIQVPSGGLLHALILSSITGEGKDRTMKYFTEWYIKRYGSVSRSEKVVDLTRINTTVVSIQEKLDQEIILATSTTAKELEARVFTRAKLMAQIHKMASAEKEKDKSERVKIDVKKRLKKGEEEPKGDIIKHLVEWRAAVFAKNPTLKEDTVKAIKEKHRQKGLSSKESRVELMKHPLFKLSESVRTKERYNRKDGDDDDE